MNETAVSSPAPDTLQDSIVVADGIRRRYGEGETAVHALRGVKLGESGGPADIGPYPA